MSSKLVILFGLFLLLNSCLKSSYHKLYRAKNQIELPVLKSPFSNHTSSLMYRAKIHSYGRYLSGILIIKSMDSLSTKVVFAKETGLKMLDLEFVNDTFIVHYALEVINKPVVLKTIGDDISMILMQKSAYITNTGFVVDESLVYRFLVDNLYDYVEVYKNKIKKIERVSYKGKKKVIILYPKYDGVIPSKIIVNHTNFNLKMELDLMKN